MYVRSIDCYRRAQSVRTHSALKLDDGELGSVPLALRGRLLVSPRDFLFRLVQSSFTDDSECKGIGFPVDSAVAEVVR